MSVTRRSLRLLDRVLQRLTNTQRRKFVTQSMFIGVLFVSVLFLLGGGLAGEIIVFAIFALAYNHLLGYAGEMSFGHAAFFGTGAYTSMLAAKYITESVFVSIAAGTLAALIVSIVFGFVSLRRRGLYFAMVTLALAQMLYFLVLQLGDITGGYDGATFPLYEAYVGPINILDRGLGFFIFALISFFLIWSAFFRMSRSPYGEAIQAVRDSEDRARHLGYNVDRLLLIAFTFSGTVSGFAGAMYVILISFVSPDVLFWSTSGEIVLISILGGIGAFAGPVIGAIAYISLREVLSGFTEHFPLIFGLIIVIVVIYSPDGIYGFFQRRAESIHGRRKRPRSNEKTRGGKSSHTNETTVRETTSEAGGSPCSDAEASVHEDDE